MQERNLGREKRVYSLALTIHINSREITVRLKIFIHLMRYSFFTQDKVIKKKTSFMFQ
jgi:hypothetical protein